jgi:hypothetical protein
MPRGEPRTADFKLRYCPRAGVLAKNADALAKRFKP